MSDTAETDLAIDENRTARAMERALDELEQRVRKLETTVAALPDARQIEEHVTARVKSSIAPPIDPAQAPSFKDIALPIPSVQTMVGTAQTTWMLFEMLAELQMLFWMLVDRRYHMAWLSRFIAIILLTAIFTTQLWLPLAFDNIVGRIWEKVIILCLSFVMFMMLHYEMRRYQAWRKRR